MLNTHPPIFIQPEPSRATRHISLTGRFSYRGALVACFGGVERSIAYESLLERECLLMLLADTSCVDVWEQPPAITFTAIDGVKRHHTLDFLATFEDGRKRGYACKVYEKIWKPDGTPTDIHRNIARVSAMAGFPIRIVTEKSFSRIQIQDAQLMHQCSNDRDPEADEAVLMAMKDLRGDFPVRTLAQVTGLQGRAFRAAVRQFRAGRLIKAQKRRFDIDTLVSVRHG